MQPVFHWHRDKELVYYPIHAQGLLLEGLNPYFIIQIGNIFS